MRVLVVIVVTSKSKVQLALDSRPELSLAKWENRGNKIYVESKKKLKLCIKDMEKDTGDSENGIFRIYEKRGKERK